MKILILSYTQLEREGRLSRAYNSLNMHYDIHLIDSSEEYRKTQTRTSIKLKNKRSLLKNIEFFIMAVIAASDFDYDIIYAHDYYTALAATVLSVLRNKPMIYDAYELYYPSGQSEFSLRDRIFYFFEKIAIKHATDIVCASEERALIMAGHYNLKRLPVVIRNVNVHDSSYKKTKPKDITANEKIKIVYTGYLSKDRSLIELIIKIGNSSLSEKVRLDIYGNGPLSGKLQQIDLDGEYTFFSFKGPYLNSDLDLILQDYHIGYLAYPNTDYNNIFCSPNKLFDYVANGLVVVAPYNYSLKKIINDNKIGSCSNEIINSLNEVISDYHNYYDNLEPFVKENQWLNEEKKLLEVFNSQINGKC